MKKTLSLALFAFCLFLVSSCSKSLDKTFEKSSSRASAITPQELSYLTSQTWAFFELFSNFNSAGAYLLFKQNRTQQVRPLWLVRYKFEPDSTFWEVRETGDTAHGYWSVVNNGTAIRAERSTGSGTSIDIFTFTALTANRFEWLNGSNQYGVMLPGGWYPDWPTDPVSYLTAPVWKYEKYITDYDVAPARLAYRINKPNVSFNLSQNRVKFNTDGTYWEIDQNGQFLSGTWTFNGGEVTVNNAAGTFTSRIKRLEADRYEWETPVNSDVLTVAEMVAE
jgi:hypothetical protein